MFNHSIITLDSKPKTKIALLCKFELHTLMKAFSYNRTLKT
jgi:hypothetical protein